MAATPLALKQPAHPGAVGASACGANFQRVAVRAASGRSYRHWFSYPGRWIQPSPVHGLVLLVLLFLLAQAGALAHGFSHVQDQAGGDEPVCELCLAYAPLGAAAVGKPSPGFAPASFVPDVAAVVAAAPGGFRAIYRSRAPPVLR